MPDQEATTATDTTATDTAAADKATTDEATVAADKAKADEALGDAGKQAIDRMKAERNTAREEAKAAREAAAALQAKIDGKEAEHAASTAQAERDAAALAKADERILKAEVRAVAAGKLADPADALKFLDLSALEVGADGEVDSAAVTALIDNLITQKPYLAAVQDGKRFQGGADGGARKESRPAQLTRSDLDNMTPEQINVARREGRLANVL